MNATIRPTPDGSRSDEPKPDRLIPPRPDPAPPGLSEYQILATYRKNALSIWSERAYEEDIIASVFLGRDRILINNPDGIRRVLVDNHTNYRRSPSTIRILRPLLGRGLFLSEGDDWRHQRHTLAPAFTPRTIPLLARHVVDATRDALIRIEAQAEAVLVVASLVSAFRIEPAGQRPIRPTAVITTQPDHAAPFRLSRRGDGSASNQLF